MADEGHIRELRAAAKRYQLRLAPNLDAESILLELCVTMLQRMMRLRYTLFKTFGNLLFARAVDASTGLPRAADYGTIAWKKETEDSPYLVCSDTTSPKLLANFLRYGPWKIARPNLLITIFGSARDFKLEPPKLARLFSKGFAEAVTTAKAVVTTAGTDAGVAKLVADALAQSGSGLPVIGVAPYQKMTGWKELLDGKNGEEVSYTNLPDPGKPGESAPLNHDHTHFVLVDSGARTDWGTELHLRAEFEAAYARMLHIPVATLCVQGGPGTVQGLHESCHGRPGGLRTVRKATRTSLPRAVRTRGAGQPVPAPPRAVHTGYAHQPRAYRTYRVPWHPQACTRARSRARPSCSWPRAAAARATSTTS